MKINKKEELEKAAKHLLNLKESINLLDLVINRAALDDGDSLALQIILKKYNKEYEELLTHYEEMRTNG